MLNSFENINFHFLTDFNFNVDDELYMRDAESIISLEEIIFSFCHNNSFNNSLEIFPLELAYLKNLSTSNNKPKKIFSIKKSIINKKFSRTRHFIKELLGLNLNSYEVNHIIKLIKSAWISGIYSLLNKYLNNLFNKKKFKAENFIFEFNYIKTSLIKTDNAKDNLDILNICVKDLLTGIILNNNRLRETNADKIKNNTNLISFLNNIIKDESNNDKESIKIIKKILLILEKNISFFVEAIWKSLDRCSKIENEFKIFCNKNIFIKKFKKSKEIVKIIKNIIKCEYPKEYEIIIKEKGLKDINSKENNLLNELEENNIIKGNLEIIIEKLLELSKKDKFISYFKEKIDKNSKVY